MEETQNAQVSEKEAENVQNTPTAEEYYAQLQRVMADFDNYRKRVTKEKDALYNIISAELITEFLPVLDTLEKSAFSINADDEKSKAWKEGVELVCKQFEDVLKKLGAEEIKAVGEAFDPNLHDAVIQRCIAIFPGGTPLDLSTQRVDYQLQTIANAQYGNI